MYTYVCIYMKYFILSLNLLLLMSVEIFFKINFHLNIRYFRLIQFYVLLVGEVFFYTFVSIYIQIYKCKLKQ